MQMFAPRASSTSAAPLLDVAARLPCFATLQPPAAQTKPDVVEILNDPDLSPPVPTISNTPSQPSTGRAWARIALAQAVISSIVVPLACSAVKKAAVWTGVVSPLIISLMTAIVSSMVKSIFCISFTVASRIMMTSPSA